MIASQRLPAGVNFPRNFALALFRIRNKLCFGMIMFEMTLHQFANNLVKYIGAFKINMKWSD